MNKQYQTTIEIELLCQWTDIKPTAKLYLDEQILWVADNPGLEKLVFSTELLSSGPHRLSIVFQDKDYLAFEKTGKDTMIHVTSLKFEDFEHNFAIYSRYQPLYPELWAEQQLALGNKLDKEIHSNYLGWNGEWYLDFELPIYQWMHQKINYGWLV